jgi:hypothetical protein
MDYEVENMTLLHARVVNDWKLALKNKDQSKDTLSLVINELKNRAIKDNIGVGAERMASDEAAIEVFQKMAKQRREAIDAYKAANRNDLAEKEQRELLVIEGYLPKALTDDELKAMVLSAITELSATSMKDMGKVMAKVISVAAGRADGKRIQTFVQQSLNKA